MSASTPDPSRSPLHPHKSSGDPAVAPLPVSSGRGLPVYLAASVGFHALLLGSLMYFAPAQLIALTHGGSGSRPSPGQAKQVMDQVRERQSVSLAASLKQLRDLRNQVGQLEQDKRDLFKEYAAEMAKDAPRRLGEIQGDLAKAQAYAAAAVVAADTATTQYVAYRAGSDFDAIHKAQQAAKEAQAKATQLQQQVSAVLAVGSQFAAARALQEQAQALQDQANQALSDAENARDPSRASRTGDPSPEARLVEHFAYELRRANTDLSKLPADIAGQEKKVADAEAAVRTLAPATRPTTASAVDTQQAAARYAAAVKALQTQQRRLADLNKREPEIRKRIADNTTGLAAAREKVKPLSPTPQDQQLLDAQAKVRDLQSKAQAAQAAVTQALTAAGSEGPTGNDPSAAALAELDRSVPTTAPAPDKVNEADLAGLYDAAVHTEAALTDDYRKLRAMELAMTSRVPLDQALKLVDVARVNRPDLRTGLRATVRSGADLPVARQAIQTAKAQVGAMVELAQSLVSEAKDLDHSNGTRISVSDMADRYDQTKQMDAVATETDNNFASDLAGMMKGDGGGPGESGFPGNGGNGGPGGPGGLGGGGLSSAWLSGPGTTPLSQALGHRIASFPGRRVAADGPSPDWMFVDSWYVLGPFPNPRRANLNRQFPPETVVDLNAVYSGKDNVPIHWEFYQSGTPNVIPPLDGYNYAKRWPGLTPQKSYLANLQWIIYYAYTELYFEKDCDLWVAVGSDDFSKIWVNDQLIWRSGTRLKAWRIDEGMRRVHFKKGVNRVLYRVENADNVTQFSFTLCFKT